MSAINLSALKKSSAKDLLQKLQKGIEDSSSKGGAKDDRIWSPTIDQAGNGSAIIRFLPAKTEDSFPYVKEYKHAFQENGMWMIAECPSTIGKPCPVCESNGKLWNSGLDSDKEIARARKRKLKYVANVLIIKDPAHPELEGQVKIYKFGQKIFDKIEECFKVDPDLGEEAMNPFGFFDGANFAIKTQMVAKFINYDKCKFVKAPDLYDGDETKLIAVMESMHDLSEFNAPGIFKSYDEIKARFDKVTGSSGVSQNVGSSDKEADNTVDKYRKEPTKADDSTSSDTSADTSIDADIAFFQELLNQ